MSLLRHFIHNVPSSLRCLLEWEYEYLPLPYKEDQAFVVFPVDPNKDWDVWLKPCRCSLCYRDSRCFEFLAGATCAFRVVTEISGCKVDFPENLNTYCTKNRIYASSSPHTALPLQSRLFSGSSRTCFLLQKAFCEHTGEQLVYIPLFPCICNAVFWSSRSVAQQTKPFRITWSYIYNTLYTLNGDAAVYYVAFRLIFQFTEVASVDIHTWL